jgi:hypothetical protein
VGADVEHLFIAIQLENRLDLKTMFIVFNSLFRRILRTKNSKKTPPLPYPSEKLKTEKSTSSVMEQRGLSSVTEFRSSYAKNRLIHILSVFLPSLFRIHFIVI